MATECTNRREARAQESERLQLLYAPRTPGVTRRCSAIGDAGGFSVRCRTRGLCVSGGVREVLEVDSDARIELIGHAAHAH